MKKIIIVFILMVILGGSIGCSDTKTTSNIKPYNDPTVEHIIIEPIVVENIIIG